MHHFNRRNLGSTTRLPACLGGELSTSQSGSLKSIAVQHNSYINDVVVIVGISTGKCEIVEGRGICMNSRTANANSTSEYCTIRFTQLVVGPYSTVLYRHMKETDKGMFAVQYDYS